MNLTPTRLLRLYPRYWRERYGEEFLALLESTDLTRRQIVDVVRGAAGEWVARTVTGRVLIALTLSTVATVCALALQAFVKTPWPGTVVFMPGLFALAVARFVSVWFMGAPRVGPHEFRAWLLALFLAAAGSQWAHLVRWDGTRVVRDSLSEIWIRTVFTMFNCLIQLLMASDHVYDPRLRPRPPFSTAPPARPLGLFGSNRVQP